MEKEMLLKIILKKILLGWDFEKTYNHLLIIDDLQKINKDKDISNNYSDN
jgi:hypothetical protein